MVDYLSDQPLEMMGHIMKGLDPDSLDALCSSNREWRERCSDRSFKLSILRAYYKSLSKEERNLEFLFLLESRLSIKEGERLEALIQADKSLVDTVLNVELTPNYHLTDEPDKHHYPISLSRSNLGTYILLKYGANPQEGLNTIFESQLELFLRFGAGPISMGYMKDLLSMVSIARIILDYNALKLPKDLIYEIRSYDSFTEINYSYLQAFIDRGWKMSEKFLADAYLEEAILYLVLTAITLSTNEQQIVKYMDHVEDDPRVADRLMSVVNLTSELKAHRPNMDTLYGYPFEVLNQLPPLPSGFWAKKYFMDFKLQPPPGIDPKTAYHRRYIMPIILLDNSYHTLSYEMGRGFCTASALTDKMLNVKSITIAGKDLKPKKGVLNMTLVYQLFGFPTLRGKVPLTKQYTDGVALAETLRDVILDYRGEFVQALPTKNFTVNINGYTVQFNRLEFIEGVAIFCQHAGMNINEICKDLKHWIFD